MKLYFSYGSNMSRQRLESRTGIVVPQGWVLEYQGWEAEPAWARTVAVVLAGLSILANFLWIPYYPVWSLTVIAFDVFVIWALVAHGRDVART